MRDVERWEEPLVTLICCKLASHPAGKARLRTLIDEHWPSPKDLGPKDIDKMVLKPIQHRVRKKTTFMIKLVKNHREELLKTLPVKYRGEPIKAITTELYDLLMGKLNSPSLNSDPIERKLAALRDLIHVKPSDIGKPQTLEGEYFGYRRSTTRGTIIRFSLEIRHLGKGLYQFQNQFRDSQNEWVVDGVGFFSKANLYLVGHASSKNGKVGRGLRCFAIRPDPNQLNVVSGVLLTTEASDRPIVARIVLIPVKHHRSEIDGKWTPLTDLAGALAADRNIWIKDDVQIDNIDKVIDLPHHEPASTLLTQGIRNGSVSTVRFDGCDGTSGSMALADERALLELLKTTHANPTILYLGAIEGAKDRMDLKIKSHSA